MLLLKIQQEISLPCSFNMGTYNLIITIRKYRNILLELWSEIICHKHCMMLINSTCSNMHQKVRNVSRRRQQWMLMMKIKNLWCDSIICLSERCNDNEDEKNYICWSLMVKKCYPLSMTKICKIQISLIHYLLIQYIPILYFHQWQYSAHSEHHHNQIISLPI